MKSSINLFQNEKNKRISPIPLIWFLTVGRPVVNIWITDCTINVSDMLCLSDHLAMHLVVQGVCPSPAMPDGHALITLSSVLKSMGVRSEYDF